MSEPSAFVTLFSKRNRNPKQVAMLVAVCVAFAGICAFAKLSMTVRPSFGLVLNYHTLRACVGELLWCWLAADHAFSEMARARKFGHMRDWLATPNQLSSIARDFAETTARLLLFAVMATGIVEACVPYETDGIARLYRGSMNAQYAVQFATAMAMTACHAATAILAARFATLWALSHEGATAAKWLHAMSVIGGFLIFVQIASALGGWLALAVARLIPWGSNPFGGILYTALRMPSAQGWFLLALVGVQLAMKLGLAARCSARIAAIPNPDDVPGA